MGVFPGRSVLVWTQNVVFPERGHLLTSPEGAVDYLKLLSGKVVFDVPFRET